MVKTSHTTTMRTTNTKFTKIPTTKHRQTHHKQVPPLPAPISPSSRFPPTYMIIRDHAYALYICFVSSMLFPRSWAAHTSHCVFSNRDGEEIANASSIFTRRFVGPKTSALHKDNLLHLVCWLHCALLTRDKRAGYYVNILYVMLGFAVRYD